MRHDMLVTRWGARFLGRDFPVCIGRSGISRDKREGDGATPAGVHCIVGMLYRADRVAAVQVPKWAQEIGPGDLWSDDPADPAYNQMVQTPHGFGHERLRRADPMYDVVLLTSWNSPDAFPGKGSAIFLHGWRRAQCPTAGCIAVRRDHLLWIAARIAVGTRVVVRG